MAEPSESPMSWERDWAHRPGWSVLFPLALLVALSLLRLALETAFVADEIEHAHVTWLLGQGAMPYRDLHQIHMPLQWILAAPLLSALPEAASSLVALRLLALLGFAAGCVAAVLCVRELVPRATAFHTVTAVLIALAMAGQFQAYRYRPDPFMAASVGWALLAMLRMQRAPLRGALFSGAGLGLAAAFSPKMAPLCLMVPLLCAAEARRTRSWQPLLMVVPNFAGFVLALLPVVGWLVWNGIFDDFIEWTIVNNAHMLDFGRDELGLLLGLGLEHDSDMGPFLLLCILGSVGSLRGSPAPVTRTWSPALGAVLATWLAWSILSIEPNHYIYNLQAMLVPGAVLGTCGAHFVLAGSNRNARLAVFAILLAALLVRPVVKEGLSLRVPGERVALPALQQMIDATDEGRCIGFAPQHPVFCRDATELYLAWDLWFIERAAWLAFEGAEPYRAMWPPAVQEILRNPPRLIVRGEWWQRAVRAGALPAGDHRRLIALTNARYDVVDFGGVTAWVLRDQSGP